MIVNRLGGSDVHGVGTLDPSPIKCQQRPTVVITKSGPIFPNFTL